MPAFPTGTITFLFTDIEGSTKLWEQHPDAMRVSLARHDAILRAGLESHGGYVFKTVGDAFCAAFTTAPDALESVLAAQRALAAEAWGETGALKVRAALHTGAAEEREGDYFGPPLNRVARLLSAGQGGQVLLSQSAYELVRDSLPAGAALQDLGQHRLRDLARPEQVFQLVAPGLPAEFAPLRTLDIRPNNLPAQPTPLVGREREVQQARSLLSQQDLRLLTLTGPGGTGKTRLGLQVAADLIEDFEGGVFFVTLASISDPGLVPSTIAHTLGVRESGGQPILASLRSHLQGKQQLLVLDNFEQVVAAAPVVADLLGACPRLKVLVTSREPLHLQAEHEFPVPTLALPDLKRLPPAKALSQYEAVELFIQRALAVKPDFAVTNENAPAVAEICHCLDGLPLAIELAASRIKLLPPQAILGRLSSRMKLLTGGGRDLPERQQTMRGAISWSYELLDAPEQALFRRLSVFAGGCTLESAEAVCNGQRDLELDVLNGVASLVDKSLLKAEEREGKPRFTMMETLREYGLDKLAEAGEDDTAKGNHASFFLELTMRAESEVWGGAIKAWGERLEPDHDNLRAALEWSLAQAGQVETGLRLAAALPWFWNSRGHISEGRAWLESALEQSGAAPKDVRAKVLLGAGDLAFSQGDFPLGRERIERSLELFGELGDRLGVARATGSLGWLALNTEDLDAARAHFATALAAYQEIEDRRGAAHTLSSLARVAYFQGDMSRARALAEQNLAHWRALGDREAVAWELCRLAEYQDKVAFARDGYEEGLELFRELGIKEGVAEALKGLAGIAAQEGDPQQVRSRLDEMLAIRRELGQKAEIAFALNEQADFASDQGDYPAARAAIEESLAIAGEIENKWLATWCFLFLGWFNYFEGDYAAARARLDECLGTARAMGTKWGIAWGLRTHGWVAAAQGDYSAARSRLDVSLTLLRELGSRKNIPILLLELGQLLRKQGDYEAARTLLEESLAMSQATDDKQFLAASLGRLALLALDEGGLARAGALSRDALAAARESETREAVADALCAQGLVARRQGDPAQAETSLRESLELCMAMGHKLRTAVRLEQLAATAGSRQQARRAARLFGTAEALRETIGAPMPPGIMLGVLLCDGSDYARDVAAVRAQLSEKAFAAAWAEGRAMSIEAALA